MRAGSWINLSLRGVSRTPAYSHKADNLSNWPTHPVVTHHYAGFAVQQNVTGLDETTT
jgi:hypothetical protein